MEIISITNRNLCRCDFFSHLEDISNSGVQSIYLREKDLSQEEYQRLAEKVLNICNNCDIYIVKYIDVAKNLGCKNIHLSYQDFLLDNVFLNGFKNISVSVHSLDEALKSQELGATRLVTGHIFSTDCKKGIAPRGLDYLKDICKNINIPVYAIGGINPENAPKVIENGARGICLMSSLMKTDNTKSLLKKFR